MLSLKPSAQVSFAFIVVFLLALLPGYGQSAQEITPLEANQSIDRELTTGEDQVYHLTLAAGEYARVELQSGKARLSLALISEKNELIAAISDADSPDLKKLDIVAEKTTKYLIRIAPERSQTTAAKYQLKLLEKHAATAADRERFALHILDWEVVSLYRQQEKSALQQAATKGREAAVRWLALGEPERAGYMLDRAGRSLYMLSQHRAGQSAYQQAIAAFQQAGTKRAAATSLARLAMLNYSSGDIRGMTAAYTRALLIWQTTHDEEGMRLSHYLRTYAYIKAGEWQKAENLCRQLLPTAAAGRTDEWDRVYREDVLLLLGMALVGRGEPRQALVYLDEALTLARQAINVFVNGQVLWQTGLAWQKLGEWQKAVAYHKQAEAVWERVGLGIGQADVLTTLGRLYVQLGRREEAHQAYTRVIEVAGAESPRYLSTALIALARLQHDEGKLNEALTGVEQALRIIEGLRSQIPMDDARASFQAMEHEADELRNDLLVHLHERDATAGYDAAALHASETSRARALRQLLSEKRLLPFTDPAPALTKRADQLRQDIAALTNEQVWLRLSPVTPRREVVAHELSSSLAELEMVTIQIRDHNPQSATLTAPATLTLAEIQQQVLDRDTLLLEYELGEERSFLFVVALNALHTFILPDRAVIEQTARQVYESLARSHQPKVFPSMTEKQAWLQRNKHDYEQAAAQLSRMLLQPAASLLGNKRLMIVKSGMLQYVPFAALPSPGGEELRVSGFESRGENSKLQTTKRETQNSKPLVADHEIISLPSASTLAVQRRILAERKPAPKTLVVLADPIFDSYDERLDLHKQQVRPQSGVTTRTVPISELLRTVDEVAEDGETFIPRLPASRVEAEAILALVAPDERKAALDFDASYKTATHGDLDQYRFVHFATHGLLDETHPELSGLLLSQVNREGGTENGFLTTLDAFNLKLNAELVVLSGCRTALGKEVKGEGLMGLTRGFMYAGAKRVMASLWQVNDNATAELMKHFYQGMLGEKKLLPAAALRAAQLEMMNDKKWNAPYYWAAFTLQGEW